MTLTHSRPCGSSPALRVLVVDDDDAVRTVLCEILSVYGHVAFPAEGGRDAVRQLSRDRFGVVFVDLWMPDLSGQEVYAWIEKHRPDHVERVVFITGDHVSDSIHSFIESSGRPCVRKPFDMEQIEAMTGLVRA